MQTGIDCEVAARGARVSGSAGGARTRLAAAALRAVRTPASCVARAVRRPPPVAARPPPPQLRRPPALGPALCLPRSRRPPRARARPRRAPRRPPVVRRDNIYTTIGPPQLSLWFIS
ncbi:hypothetical protein EVAR_91438_1 [Eumeta japonica]|uniref:Uncharacterized protein n=1 Tax=Eumeta variegata TaxID=151549 RepID=A0A4C1WZ34_EUMVA|nr:hypothetical protein EVAR_91438_1 [Eumeta japonica]